MNLKDGREGRKPKMHGKVYQKTPQEQGDITLVHFSFVYFFLIN